MPHTSNASTEPGEPTIYQIRVKGHLGSRWERWFDDMTITPQAGGDTLLTGSVADQAALHGLLTKVRDLGLPLISVTEVEPVQADGADGTANADNQH
jgi:hypothetical protein